MTNHSLSKIFLVLFSLLLLLGPVTQLIQIINLPFHVKIGFSEENIMDPNMTWFRADEISIAWADMTCLVTGVAFLLGAAWRKPWCIPAGLYTCAIWFYIMLLARIRWPALEAAGHPTASEDHKGFYYGYSYVYIAYGLYGMYYLWVKRDIYIQQKAGEVVGTAESRPVYGATAV